MFGQLDHVYLQQLHTRCASILKWPGNIENTSDFNLSIDIAREERLGYAFWIYIELNET